MESWEHIHWFITSRCNLDCGYCFKPENSYGDDKEKDLSLAKLLVDNGVKKVTLGGGEPAIVKHLDEVLKVLKDYGIKTSIHTNGLTLDDKRISSLSGLVDDIAIPLDSLDRKNQIMLRGKPFMRMYDDISGLIEKIHDAGFGLGYHTVFTKINGQEMPEVYEFIKKRGFDYWKVYEFNPDLARKRIIDYATRHDASKHKAVNEEVIKRMRFVDKLQGQGHIEKGYVDTLFADFLLMEQRMLRRRDERVNFIGLHDENRLPYAFLDSKGNITFYTCFSGNERRVLGNILDDKSFIRDKLGLIHKEMTDNPIFYDDKAEEEWLDAKNGRELWTRIWDGAYFIEELEAIKPKYAPAFNRLERLYQRRQKRIEESAP